MNSLAQSDKDVGVLIISDGVILERKGREF